MKKIIKFNISLSENIKKINNIFIEKGYDIFLVGGCVRDSLLKITPKDYDLATNATPDTIILLLKGQPFVKNILLTGKAFGVINVITTSGEEYEVATFRSDGKYNDGRRPVSVKFGNIFDDASRRDFRFNSLYYDIKKGEIIDFFDGINDLYKKIVRTVGNPIKRFREDSLRILRCIRFAARFGSDIDPETSKAIKSGGFDLNGVSRERVRDEFLKGVKSAKSVVHFLNLLKEHNLMNWVFKNIGHNNDFIEESGYILLLANLLKDNVVDLDSLNSSLKKNTYTNKEIKAILFLVSLLKLNPDNSFVMKKAHNKSDVSDEQIKKFAKLNGLDSNLIDAFLKFQFSITGDQVMKMRFKGQEIGKEMERIEIERFKNLL